ncbi:MAG: hypothetical protein M3Q75_10895, partial [Gemmatimonadota bacterium]|nr:hypothetical protein [Gemmatimonadota bacterium]
MSDTDKGSDTASKAVKAALSGGPADGQEVADPGDGKIRWFDASGETQHIYRRQAFPDDEGRAVFAYIGEFTDGVTEDETPSEPDHKPRPGTDPNITSAGGQTRAQAEVDKEGHPDTWLQGTG